MAHETFISHSSEDKIIADAVTAALEQANIRCWIAPRDIRPGDSWGGAIVEAIEASRVMVIIFSAQSNDSKQVMREVERAVQHDVVVVPFRIEDVQPTRDMEYFLSSTHWLDAMTPEMDAHLQELSKTVSNILEKKTDDKVVAKASKKAAAGIPTKATKSTLGSRFSGIVTGIMIAAVLAIAAFFFFRGDDEDSPPSASEAAATKAKLSARQAGDIKLKFADEVRAGGELAINWSGASNARDYIAIVPADAADNVSSGRKYAGEGNSLTVDVPDKPGDYQVRYFNAASNKVIASPSLSVKLPEVSLNAPASGVAGTEISVEWTGPNDRSDQLSIASKGSAGNKYVAYAYIAKGSPTSIRLPDVAGDYVLRYVSGGGREIWKEQPLKVIQPEVSIEALAPQVAGAEIDVKWQGPANKSDYLAVAKPGDKGNEYLFYKYVKQGKAATLRLPAEAGEFELRYVSGQSKELWATRPVTIEMPAVSVTPPADAAVGDVIKAVWTGPGNPGDYLSIAEPGSDGNKYSVYKYVKPGKQTEIQMPQEPGEYEMRYVSGAKNTIWSATPFQVRPRAESLEASNEVTAGDSFNVSWSQPGYGGQYVAIFAAGAGDDDKYLTYAYTKDKTKTKLRAPAEAGNYELRYLSGNKRLVWARKPIKVIAK